MMHIGGAGRFTSYEQFKAAWNDLTKDGIREGDQSIIGFLDSLTRENLVLENKNGGTVVGTIFFDAIGNMGYDAIDFFDNIGFLDKIKTPEILLATDNYGMTVMASIQGCTWFICKNNLSETQQKEILLSKAYRPGPCSLSLDALDGCSHVAARAFAYQVSSDVTLAECEVLSTIELRIDGNYNSDVLNYKGFSFSEVFWSPEVFLSTDGIASPASLLVVSDRGFTAKEIVDGYVKINFNDASDQDLYREILMRETRQFEYDSKKMNEKEFHDMFVLGLEAIMADIASKEGEQCLEFPVL